MSPNPLLSHFFCGHTGGIIMRRITTILLQFSAIISFHSKSLEWNSLLVIIVNSDSVERFSSWLTINRLLESQFYAPHIRLIWINSLTPFGLVVGPVGVCVPFLVTSSLYWIVTPVIIQLQLSVISSYSISILKSWFQAGTQVISKRSLQEFLVQHVSPLERKSLLFECR